MLTYKVNRIGIEGFGSQVPYVEGSCLAGDTKPTNVANGSILIEMDTAKVYIFDGENSVWRVLAG